MYKFLRPLLFLLDAETSHRYIFSFLGLLYHIPGLPALFRLLYARRTPSLPVTVMGLTFPNPVGLAAGLDKNASYVRMLNDLGFGWLELGTVTPRPQEGNPQPRIFRLMGQHAIINRMGFNNVGLSQFIDNLVHSGKQGIIGINIGKNRSTANESAIDDYLRGLRTTYTYANYVTINISSPNTPGLRDLQAEEQLDDLLAALRQEQITLGRTRQVIVPIALKIAPDLDEGALKVIAELAQKHKIDGLIATNTTLARDGVEDHPLATEDGGLSGRPLKERSTNVIKTLYAELQGKIPIIGVGGIEDDSDAWEKLVAGADLVQIYTGFIYQGPAIVKKIVRGLYSRVQALGCETLKEAVEKARSGVRLIR